MQEHPAHLVADELRQQILSGHYAPGARLTTMEELRRAYGVSEIAIGHAVSRSPCGARTSFAEDDAIEWPDYQLTTRYSEVPADEELAALFAPSRKRPCSAGISCSTPPRHP